MALSVFAVMTAVLLAFRSAIDTMDTKILLAIAGDRAPQFTNVALNVTNLGSDTVLILFCVLVIFLLLSFRDGTGALTVAAGLIGGGILTALTKDLVHRVRPPEVERLVAISGFSYPSGHSLSSSALYLTIAIVASRYARDERARRAVYGAASVLVLMVGLSRMYLGAHYATDVLGGLSLGAGWAFGIASLASRLRLHRARYPVRD